MEKELAVDDVPHVFNLWDTAGQERVSAHSVNWPVDRGAFGGIYALVGACNSTYVQCIVQSLLYGQSMYYKYNCFIYFFAINLRAIAGFIEL